MLWAPPSLHIHTEQILQSPRGHTGSQVRDAHWYVVLRSVFYSKVASIGLVSSVYLPTKDRGKTLVFPDGQWDPPRPLPSYGRLWDINQTINSIWSNVKLSERLEGCPFHDQRLTESKIYDDRVNICWTEQKKLILVSLQDVFYVSCWRGTRCFPGKMKVSLATLLTLSFPHYVVVGDQLSCIIELLGMPPQKLLDQSKRAKNFISSKGRLRCRILTREWRCACRLPPLLHSHHPAGWHDGPQWWEVQERQASRPPRLPGAPDCAQGLWRPSLPRLHPQVSGVGPRRPHDA